MYGSLIPETPNQWYAERVRTADRERLGRRILRERRASRRIARRDRWSLRPRPVAVTEPHPAG